MQMAGKAAVLKNALAAKKKNIYIYNAPPTAAKIPRGGRPWCGGRVRNCPKMKMLSFCALNYVYLMAG